MSKQLIAGILTLSLCLLALYLGGEQNKQLTSYDQWKAKFGIVYKADEEVYRKMIFERNLEIINKHNADEAQTYKMGVNQFSALTEAEFIHNYLGSWPSKPVVEADGPFQVTADVDWVTQGKVSGVKNQGSCGSCWAFSATGVCESFALLHGKSVSLSEQQLVDCTLSSGNHGCNGGSRSIALKYIKDHGISLQSEYPYKAKDGSCAKQGGSFKITSFNSVQGCASIQNALLSRPIAVAVDATNWNKYSTGVFNNCGSSINHAVLLVGVTTNYWKIKNSWGTSWGEKGFIRLALGNTCGMCNNESQWPV